MTDLEKALGPLVKAIKDGKKVTFFNGAGISTSAGIPDFRSHKTGLYANLAKLDLPFAEAVFDIDYFKENPKPFYTLAEELYPGKFPPTKFHHFIKLIQNRGQLHRVYTQNIDTLERLAGVDDEFIVEAHGSFAKNFCVDCHKEMSIDTLKKHMKDEAKNGIPTCEHCGGYVKPNIVFFGEGLPTRFFDSWDDDSDEVEVAVVSGTSLTVFPFASLPTEVNKKCIRVLVNKEKVGDFGRRKLDIIALHDCDHIAETLARLLGWEKELDKLHAEGQRNVIELSEEKLEVEAEVEVEIEAEADGKREPKTKASKDDTNLENSTHSTKITSSAPNDNVPQSPDVIGPAKQNETALKEKSNKKSNTDLTELVEKLKI